STTLDTATTPARPPPQRRHPTVVTPATIAVSRWSDGAGLPLRESSRSVSPVGRATTTSGSGGPPLPIATTTVRRVDARRRATCPVTAGFPTRLALPMTATGRTAHTR